MKCDSSCSYAYWKYFWLDVCLFSALYLLSVGLTQMYGIPCVNGGIVQNFVEINNRYLQWNNIYSFIRYICSIFCKISVSKRQLISAANGFKCSAQKPILYNFTHFYEDTVTNKIPYSLQCSMNYTMSKDEESVRLALDVYRGGSTIPESEKIEIAITERESKLFKLLVDCVNYHSLDIEIRVAGGWVRDKLLKKTTKDIDIALEGVTGVEFCNFLNSFTKESMGFEKTIGIVKRRPEQSKHLETATLSIFGLVVDFVNLRTEDYASGSRIPSMMAGTPMEDAKRRDFTINSLFYNISKGAIEDFVGCGIEDLHSGIVRTCSSAIETFMDDPLRAIRAVRFSARLGYSLTDEVYEASGNPKVLEALRHKISRSRISQELEGILSRGDVAAAFEMLYKFGILQILCRSETECEPDDRTILNGCKMLQSLKECLKTLDMDMEKDGLESSCLYLAAFIYPIKDEMFDRKMSLADHVIKDNLKLSTRHATSASIIAHGSESFSKIINKLPKDASDLREVLGCTIRTIGPLWKGSLLLFISQKYNSTDNSLDKSMGNYEDNVENVDGGKFAIGYKEIIAKIDELKLNDCYTLKAPITGKELIEILPKLPFGPEFKRALDYQVLLMIRDGKKDKAQLKEYLIKEFSEFL